MKCIADLKLGKAPGADDITTEHLKYCHSIVAHILCIIKYNRLTIIVFQQKSEQISVGVVTISPFYSPLSGCPNELSWRKNHILEKSTSMCSTLKTFTFT